MICCMHWYAGRSPLVTSRNLTPDAPEEPAADSGYKAVFAGLSILTNLPPPDLGDFEASEHSGSGARGFSTACSASCVLLFRCWLMLGPPRLDCACLFRLRCRCTVSSHDVHIVDIMCELNDLCRIIPFCSCRLACGRQRRPGVCHSSQHRFLHTKLRGAGRCKDDLRGKILTQRNEFCRILRFLPCIVTLRVTVVRRLFFAFRFCTASLLLRCLWLQGRRR